MSNRSTDYENVTHLYKRRIKVNIIGFFLSIILTLIPVLLITNFAISKKIILWTISITSFIQILVHVICFFQLNTQHNESWNFITSIFTLTIISILIIGSIWIMRNLNHNMIVY